MIPGRLVGGPADGELIEVPTTGWGPFGAPWYYQALMMVPPTVTAEGWEVGGQRTVDYLNQGFRDEDGRLIYRTSGKFRPWCYGCKTFLPDAAPILGAPPLGMRHDPGDGGPLHVVEKRWDPPGGDMYAGMTQATAEALRAHREEP
jgi:hypothetical protein